MTHAPAYTAFAGHRRLAAGPGSEVAPAVEAALRRGETHVLVFDDATGEQVELGLSVQGPAIVPRSSRPKAGRGRPKLGVVAREVTLLPRHWDWLASQPGGASAALRRLVEAASRSEPDHRRQAQEAAYRVMSALAGDLPGFEDAARALFAGRPESFGQVVAGWPAEVRAYIAGFASSAFSRGSPST
jgi:hypothetical protein